MADPIRLDPEATPAGLRERLFLHETLTPAFPRYDRDDALRVMWFIRQVVENRVAHPRVFGLRPPQTEASIITNPSQWTGTRNASVASEVAPRPPLPYPTPSPM